MSHSKPVFGTEEWAAHNFNFQLGCKSDCSYCYAKSNALRYKQINDPSEWSTPKINEKTLEKKHGKKVGTIMFPTAHDIHPDNIDAAIKVLIGLLTPGNRVLVVTKPHLECITRICTDCAQFKGQVLFRFTIGSAYDETLKMWEPHAPNYYERAACLVHAYIHGFQTSVSCEPLLAGSIEEVTVMVEKFRPFVTDAIWIGKMNYAPLRLKKNGHEDMIPHAKVLEDVWNDEAVIALYGRYKDDSKVKWKESMKKVLGLEIPTEKGMDV